MKIQCNACGATEAKVLCCADEAALCLACDEKVHAANKHQRVPLLPADRGGGGGGGVMGGSFSSRVPRCDVCQEAPGYFFCLEDRALLCRKCDVAIHTSNPYVATHQRFLLTGVQVGLEPVVPVLNEELNVRSEAKGTPSKALPNETNIVLSSHMNKDGGLMSNSMTFPSINAAGSLADWTLDEFFAFPDFNQNFDLTEYGSAKGDNGKLGSSEGSPFNSSADEELGSNECLGEVPDCSWKVPEIPSPPTASGLHWQRSQSSETAAFVPDITSWPESNPCGYSATSLRSKRRRGF